MALKYALKILEPSNLQVGLGDYNGDGLFNQQDSQCILRRALKIS